MGTYFEEMNKIEPKYFDLAAECWGNANNMEKTMQNIKSLVETEPKALDTDFLEFEGFVSFQEREEWKRFIGKL